MPLQIPVGWNLKGLFMMLPLLLNCVQLQRASVDHVAQQALVWDQKNRRVKHLLTCSKRQRALLLRLVVYHLILHNRQCLTLDNAIAPNPLLVR